MCIFHNMYIYIYIYTHVCMGIPTVERVYSSGSSFWMVHYRGSYMDGELHPLLQMDHQLAIG